MLRIYKKLGLSINHAIQFILCVKNVAAYGLWWHVFLTDNNWKRLEIIWMKLLKTATHESCPRHANNQAILDLLGLHTFKSFSN